MNADPHPHDASSSDAVPQDAAPEQRNSRSGHRWTLPDGRVDLLSLDRGALEAFVAELGERSFRAKQIFRWMHQRLATSFDEMSDLKKEFRARLHERAALAGPTIERVHVSHDGTRKYQLKTHDGHTIESVYIPHVSGPGRNALCISSQVGCAMGCTFCATAALKLTRHLSPGEIAGQLYAVTRDLWSIGEPIPDEASACGQGSGGGEYDDDDDADADAVHREAAATGKAPRPVTNLVYMGMGEPLHNYAGVVGSARLMQSGEGLGYSPRRLTVSTSGLVPAIERLGQDTDVHIAISLNATTDEVRTSIMPVNKRWRIADLINACRAFPLKARRRITFEYVMLRDVNDSDADAHRLVQLLKGMRSKVNLIPFNPHPLSPFDRPDDVRVARFQRILEDAQLTAFVRTTRGLDIDAACGMLGAKALEAARGRPLPVQS